jgi:signal transduction histidine kinase
MSEPASILDPIRSSLEGPSPVRFLWRADGEARFTHVSPELAAVVGDRAAAIVGRSWDELRASGIDDPDALVAAAFAQRQTFSAHAVSWTTDDGRPVAVDFAGMPIFDADRTLVGFRGFGLLRPERAAAPDRPLRPKPLRLAAAPPARSEPRQSGGRWFSDIRQRLLAHLAGAKGTEAEKAREPEAASVAAVWEPRRAEAALSDEERSAFQEIAAALSAGGALEGSNHTRSTAVEQEPDENAKRIAETEGLQTLQIELAARTAPLQELEDELHAAHRVRADAKEAAGSARAQKADLLARIVEEIRAPLERIVAFSADMLEERLGQLRSDKYQDYLKDIRVSAMRIGDLIDDVAEIAKIEAGRLDLSPAPENLNELVAGCVSEVEPRATRERVVIRTSLAPKLPPAVFDARTVRQVCLTLIVRSVEASEAGGQVIVSTAETEERGVALRVRDAGPGLSDAEIAAALDPLRQPSLKTPGFGLARAKAVVEANGGRLAVSSGQGQGTLLEVIFPVAR